MSTNLCMGCMSKKTSEGPCPRCGYTEGTPNRVPSLAVGTVLDGRYLVGACRGLSGEGAEYIALDQSSGRRVILREYLPVSICSRKTGTTTVLVRDGCQHVFEDYLSDFLEISRAVSRLSDVQAIVPVIDIFEANNTAYAVYEYANGRSLAELIERAGRLTWDEAKPLFVPLVAAMVQAHSIGLVHFALNPDNVLLTRDGNLIITNFGIPDARSAETELHATLTDGFSALEQYSISGKMSKSTDVYSICALMLFSLTGKCPPPALQRAQNPRLNVPGSLAETIPTHVLTAIAGGLQVNADQRTPSMDRLYSELTGRPIAAGGAARGANGAGQPQRSGQSAGAWAGNVGNQAAAAFSTVAGAVSGFASNVVKQGKNMVQKASEKSQERSQQNRSKAKNQQNNDEPWYRRLSQFQYGLLSACISIIVLGLIAVIVFVQIKPLLNPDDHKGPNVEYIGYASGTDLGLIHTESYIVPDFRGMDWDVASSNPEYQVFCLLQKDEDYSDDYDVDQIMKQSVDPGDEVPYGTPITVTISLGSKMCKIPNIVGQTVANADTLLTEAGLRLGKQKEEYSDSVPQGSIISLSGAEIGSRMERGSAVNVVVSLGPEDVLDEEE